MSAQKDPLRRKAIDDLYAVFAPDVVLEAEVEAILARIVALDAALRAAPAEPQPAVERLPPNTRLILASDNLLEVWGSRTERGERITAEWGEPSPEGWYMPQFTAHADDMLVPTATEPAPRTYTQTEHDESERQLRDCYDRLAATEPQPAVDMLAALAERIDYFDRIMGDGHEYPEGTMLALDYGTAEEWAAAILSDGSRFLPAATEPAE